MTDPTFETLEAFEAWERRTKRRGREYHRMGRNSSAIHTVALLRRVLSAHAHLLKGQMMVEVTQADREAAANWMGQKSYDWGFCGDVREGRVEHDLPQAFATHRIESTAALQSELDARAATIEALQKRVAELEGEALPKANIIREVERFRKAVIDHFTPKEPTP